MHVSEAGHVWSGDEQSKLLIIYIEKLTENAWSKQKEYEYKATNKRQYNNKNM